MNRLWMTRGCASRRGPREACYVLRVCACTRSAAYSEYALLPMSPTIDPTHYTRKSPLYIVPDIWCTDNNVWPVELIMSGITVKSLRVISQFATCVAPILRNWMCLQPLNSCRYGHHPCSVSSWVDLESSDWLIHVPDDCVPTLPQFPRLNLH